MCKNVFLIHFLHHKNHPVVLTVFLYPPFRQEASFPKSVQQRTPSSHNDCYQSHI